MFSCDICKILKNICVQLLMQKIKQGTRHCVKSVKILSFFWSAFSCIRTEYGDLLRKSSYSVRIQENTDQKDYAFGHFTQRELFQIFRALLMLYVTKYFQGLFSSWFVEEKLNCTSKPDPKNWKVEVSNTK